MVVLELRPPPLSAIGQIRNRHDLLAREPAPPTSTSDRPEPPRFPGRFKIRQDRYFVKVGPDGPKAQTALRANEPEQFWNNGTTVPMRGTEQKGSL